MQKSLKLMVDNVPASIYWKDLNGKYLGCNKFVLEMAGLSSTKEIIGKTDFDLPWYEQALGISAIDTHVIKTALLIKTEEYPYLKDGRKLAMLSHKQPFFDNTGRLIGIIGISIDITAQQKTQQASKLETLHQFQYNFNLTPREAECVYYTVRSMTAKQIARAMGLSNRTVESYLNNAKLKLNCETKQALILKIFEVEII